ncbi:MAG: hypothetical protein ACKVX9_05730, partial [Blastocatellia bacterium]
RAAARFTGSIPPPAVSWGSGFAFTPGYMLSPASQAPGIELFKQPLNMKKSPSGEPDGLLSLRLRTPVRT